MALHTWTQRNFTHVKASIKNIVSAPGLYPFFLKLRPFTGRHYFLVLCIGGLLWYALFTRQVIGKIRSDAVAVTQSYAELVRTAISERMSDQEIGVVFTEVIQKLNFPVIVTDTLWEPITWKNVSVGAPLKRRVIASDDTTLASRVELRKAVERMRLGYEPKPIFVGEEQTRTGYLIYGDSDIVRSSAWMPFVELGLVISILLFTYLAFHNIRVTERGNLWVGLAKETAHQLGTPISSLMGWVEYMQTAAQGDSGDLKPEEFMPQVDNICENMQSDLMRLRKVTARFSQIGSVPALTPMDINAVIRDVMKYFNMRLPLLGRRVVIRQELGEIPPVPANRELIEWVFENLTKNALDAINKPEGVIEIKSEYIDVDKIVRIYHRDNGKGISWEDQKKVFSPGFTTKTRGWGLGLTLAKRIVEDYHQGHIYVNWSQRDRGTVFCIDLPVAS
jgi:hypothetical protein